METPIRVLMLEDTDDDKELVLRQLRNGGYNPEYICIETRLDLNNALDNHHWDIILCDYSMPKFDGLSALRVVQEKKIDIPFILISGTVGEDVAVEAMKSGAQDYMLKDNLIRLVPVVKRELKEAEIRKEKRIAEDEIRNQNAVLDAIINNSHSIIIFMLDTEYRYLGFNENHRKAMKLVYGADIVVGMNMLELIHIQEYRKKAKISIDRVLSGESFVETQVQPEINTYYEFHWNNVRKDDLVIGVSCFIIDITKRKLSEMALKESTQFNLQIINSAQEGIIVYDQDMKYLTWNPYMENLTGMPASEVLGKYAFDLFPFLKHSGIMDNIKKALKGETSDAIDFPFNMANGEKRGWVSDTLAPMRNSQGEIIGAISTVQNITERKEEEKKLTIALEKATESDRLKSAFLANMSHEIRTPMNGIMGFSGLLKEPNLTGQEQKRYIEVIEKSGERMLNIINNIIDISKIESGTMEVMMQETNINIQLDYILTFFKLEIKSKNIELLLKRTLSPIEANIITDSEKIYAVLLNLVKNAIKYTVKGSIELRCDLVEIQNSTFLQFSVKDTGIGIAKDRQEAIFERFIQADIEDPLARQGAGLGLSISKGYIEMLGGDLWLESKKGMGSTFYFTLPYHPVINENEAVEPKDLSSEEGSQLKKLKILIVEDDEPSEMLISIELEGLSKEILTAKTGLEAVEICQNNADIDLILMDIRMPVMNGYEATQQIRRFNKEIIIIAQTAFALTGDKEKAIDAGCNDYITKPIDKEELRALIRKYFVK